mgnify:CR=1 FL=1
MLSQNQYKVLRAYASNPHHSQREIASLSSISLGTVNKVLRDLGELGLIDTAGSLTSSGREELERHRVRHAVILAAGLSTRFAPLSFERPKGLFRVRGEILIERLIRQMREAGIEDVRIVVGHMKEQYYYLEDKFGVTLIENRAYLERNNHASLGLALGNVEGGTYVCSSDQYLPDNIFRPYEYASYCSAVFMPSNSGEQPLAIGPRGRITGAAGRSSDGAWCMLGPAYFDVQTVGKYLEVLDEVYELPETKSKLWEQIVLEHIEEFSFFVRKLPEESVFEFDFLDDLCAFDTDFMDNVDSKILDNICTTLACTRSDITHVEPLNAGLTNLSVLFDCRGDRYVYRHPGAGTDAIVNRKAETHALKVAAELGLDTSFVFEDPTSGWKISRYIPHDEFDYRNPEHVATALSIARRLHTSGATSPYSFDFYDEACKIVDLLKREGWNMPGGFSDVASSIERLIGPMRDGAGRPVLCHNDFYGPNLLVTEDGICLIDWEYAAMGDYGCDFGNFIAQGSGYSVQEALSALPLYFGREATDSEAFHCIACVAVVGWYWYVWAMYKECKGSPVGEWLSIWYKAAKSFSTYALSLLDADASEGTPLTQDEFDVLAAAENKENIGRFDTRICRELERRELISGGTITWKGLKALEPHRVRRAIFLAAGFGSRMLPVTVNTPKPLARVHGVRIIDRLLDAVVAAGIKEIYVVRGYLGEEFDQLLSKYPSIKFIDNTLYSSTNNISSALAAKDFFRNAYVFESDLFLTNPSYVSKYQFRSNYLAIPVKQTEDWYFDVDDEGKITHIGKGSDRPCWQMVGLSYWTEEDGSRLAEDIPAVFSQGGECQQIFWDDVALDRRPENYDVRVRSCSMDDIIEIDTFEDLRRIDPAYQIGH